MKTKIFFTIWSVVAALAVIVYSQTKGANFAPAEDFPRGALVYAQINDLPTFVKLFSESEFAARYAASENFADFNKKHLGRKLASRWREFSDAAGFSLDWKAIAGLTETGATIAVYDVGKLEFVFVAPVRGEIFAATEFFRRREKFRTETLAGGTIIYRTEVEADRARQKQELIFANVENRFVLATSEKLLAQTLKNISGETAKNRLSDEPAFAALSAKIEPHLATVWVNQTALNEDYYFKRYWLLSDTANLKNIRAGIFDFEMQAGKLIEHRRFLLENAIENAALDSAQTEKMLSFLPANIPFFRLSVTDARVVNETIDKTIFERRREMSEQKNRRSIYSSFDATDYDDAEDYDYLSGNFDENIDETEADETIERAETKIDFAASLASANAQAVLTFASPQISPSPLFVDFRRAAVFRLDAPEKFDRQAFETTIGRKFAAQTLIAASDVELIWETKTENGALRRELKLPMLEWRAVYALRGDLLIVANDESFFREIPIENHQANKNPTNQKPVFAELTVINMSERKSAYDDVFNRLIEKDAADDFFTGNVKSLLDSVSEIKKIEIRKNYSQNILAEELIFSYQ